MNNSFQYWSFLETKINIKKQSNRFQRVHVESPPSRWVARR